MTTLLLTHPASLDHLTPPGHPERPDRIRAVGEVLGEDRFNRLVREDAPWKTWPELAAYGRANPDKMVYGASGGLGNTSHIFVEEAAARENSKWTPVPSPTTEKIEAQPFTRPRLPTRTTSGSGAMRRERF